jgi:5'-3' exonuclease
LDNCRIGVIDLDSVAYSIFHPNKVDDGQGGYLRENNKFVYVEKTEEEIVLSVDSCMHYVLQNSGATHYIAYIKGKGNYRYEIEPNYKANRSKLEQPKHWELVKRLLIEKWNAVEVNGIEVDDAVNITYRALDNTFICAIDTDLLSLQSLENRPHWNWRKQEHVTITEEQAAYKFWTDMITGQSGDNIKGLVGKGKVFAKNLLVGDYKEFRMKVLGAYEQVYKDSLTTDYEVYKNFNLLYILDSKEDFIIPEINKYNKYEINLNDY